MRVERTPPACIRRVEIAATVECRHGEAAKERAYCRSGAKGWAAERGKNRSHQKESRIHQTACRGGFEGYRGCFVRPSRVGSSIGRRRGSHQADRVRSEYPILRACAEHEGSGTSHSKRDSAYCRVYRRVGYV